VNARNVLIRLGTAWVDDVAGSGTTRSAQHRGLGNDGAEAPGRTRRWRGGSEEDTMMARTPGRPTMARALGKFSAGNFGSLMV
jgi:hypothetical protein